MNNYQRQVTRPGSNGESHRRTHVDALYFLCSTQAHVSEHQPAPERSRNQCYEQGEGASTNILLETFRESDAVLLGTRAFWEGVDIPGAALSVLAIVKLPFDVRLTRSCRPL